MNQPSMGICRNPSVHMEYGNHSSSGDSINSRIRDMPTPVLICSTEYRILCQRLVHRVFTEDNDAMWLVDLTSDTRHTRN